MKIINHAFSLAEALITIALIGIVATIVIGNIVSKNTKHMIKTRLRQTDTILTQVFKRAEVYYGDASSWSDIPSSGMNKYSNAAKNQTINFIQKYMLPYMKAEFKADISYSNMGYKTGIKYPNGSLLYSVTETRNFIRLDNGIILMPYAASSGTVTNGGISIMADVNGHKGPNIIGTDIFYWQFNSSSKKLGTMQEIGFGTRYNLTTGLPTEYSTLQTIKENCYDKANALSCSSLIKYNNWEIPDDYPYL